MKLYCILLFLSFIALHLAEDPNMGHACKDGEKGDKPGIKYYVDRRRNVIYPFFYHGCGAAEDRNRYSNRDQARGRLPSICSSTCDGYAFCTGMCVLEGPARGLKGASIQGMECPKGSTCQRGWPSDMCCPDGVSERFELNQKAPCSGGKTAVKEGEEILFGRKCAHNFCPEGSECVDGEFEAYCCKK